MGLLGIIGFLVVLPYILLLAGWAVLLLVGITIPLLKWLYRVSLSVIGIGFSLYVVIMLSNMILSQKGGNVTYLLSMLICGVALVVGYRYMKSPTVIN